MKFKKMFSVLILTLMVCISPLSCFAFSYNLSFNHETDDTYTIISTHKSGKKEGLWNFDLFFIGNPYANIISKNSGQKFELTGNQLNKLKRSIRIFNMLREEFNQCSWGEKRVNLHKISTKQQEKLLALLKEIFQQNHFNIS